MLSLFFQLKNCDDLQFMEQLFEEYERLIYRTANYYAHDKNLAEDIVQDSLVSLIKHISDLHKLDRCILAGYIVTTVRNTAYSAYRKAVRQGKFRAPSPDWAEEPVDPLTLEDLNHVLFRRHALAAAWKRLSEREQLLLYGKYFMGLSDKELAGILGCKPDSVRTLLTRARRSLAGLIRNMEEEKL